MKGEKCEVHVLIGLNTIYGKMAYVIWLGVTVDRGLTWWLYIHGDCLCVCFCDTGVLSVVHHTCMPQVEEEALVVVNSGACNCVT